jgi:DNA polymerase-3 subunit gamma/tau
LLEDVLVGNAADALAQLDEAHALGLDPASLLRGLMETLHSVTRAKAGASGDVLQSVEEREAAADWASRLSWGSLHRLWQMLLKGLADVQIAPDPNEAAAMALLRLIHSADLPDPAALLARLAGGGDVAVASAPAAKPTPASSQPADFASLVATLEASGKHRLGIQLRDHVGLVRFAPGELVLRPLRPLGADFARELAAAAKDATGSTWAVSFTDEGGEPSLHQQDEMVEEKVRAHVLGEPMVRAVLEVFPDAELETYAATTNAGTKGA